MRATRGGGRAEPRVFPTYRLGEDRESGGAATVQAENREYLFFFFYKIREMLNEICSVETSQGREQLRQAIHLGEDGFDSHGQIVHDESGSNGVYGFLVSQSGIRATRLNRWNILKVTG